MKRKLFLLLALLLICSACTSSAPAETPEPSPTPTPGEPAKTETDFRVEQLQTIAGFDETRLEDYLQYFDLGPHYVVSLVNQGIVNEENYGRLLDLTHDPYFLLSRASRYLDNPKETVRETVESVNADRDRKPFDEAVENDPSEDLLVQANKYYHFPDGYVPEDMVPIAAQYGIQTSLRKPAYEAYIRMYEAARAEGLDFYITSAYRSYDKQVSLYNNYVRNDGVEAADRYSARPGFSDHQTGLTVDILTSSSNFSTFEYTAEAKWLAENAPRFGFIMRYPDGKEDVTGYTYESWHFRYVGDIAEAVTASGLTYDEYYTYFVKGE
ncbi:MAG: M15 family metallopeptidase [Erysipelotrichaceae bacterium]|nr:M15 family metallopeptidase [Erysipelotrichaceae bacterium]